MSMNDYIKREDAIRQIVKASAQNFLDIPAIGRVLYVLSEMDSADVVEVVRCKDCKHFDTGYCGIPFIGKKVNPNHYCSFGEREGISLIDTRKEGAK